MARRSKSSPFRLDWHGDDLVVLLEDKVVARRKRKRWHLYAPIVVKDEPDGGVTIAAMTRGDLNQHGSSPGSAGEAAKV